jgi:c(7)-type cytochrome triheme protein
VHDSRPVMARGWGLVYSLLAGALLVALVVGCDSRARYHVLTLVADGVPPYDEWMNPKPSPPRFRRGAREAPQALPPPPKVAVRVELPAGSAGFPATWEALSAALPQDAAGDVDWAKALADGLIAPRSTIPPAEPEEQEILDVDVERRADDPALKVVFPHAAHTRWLACDSCHPDLFQMEAGATPMSMDEINEGKGCGLCHGTVAFSATTCGRCHPGMAE